VPWRYLEDRAIADVAFSATGKSLEELFGSSVDALVNAMVTNLASIIAREKRPVEMSAEGIDMLLFELLQEVIFCKDAEGLLLRLESIKISGASGGALPMASLSGVLSGERIDPRRHMLAVDVKAVTLYRYRVEAVQDGWEAEVVLDV
jgi:SHS2 domain-containing protein